MASLMGPSRGGWRRAPWRNRPRGAAGVALAVVAALVVLATTLHAASTRAPRPVGVGGRWHLILDSEFRTLDASRWSTSRYDDGMLSAGFNSQEQECLDPSEVTFGGGGANLQLVSRRETCGGQQKSYAGSVLTTFGKFEFTYGFVEARVWVPGSGGR